jgi:hypothetical protein
MNKQGLSVAGLRGRVVLGACLAGMAILLASASEAGAQKGQGQYVTQASQRLAGLISKANDDGYKLANNKFSLGGGWLKQGKEWVNLFTITLDQGKEYRILAAGDNDAMDVDVQVVDPDNINNALASDTARSSEAVVNFRPNNSKRYLVRVRLYASQENRPAVCLGIVMGK